MHDVATVLGWKLSQAETGQCLAERQLGSPTLSCRIEERCGRRARKRDRWLWFETWYVCCMQSVTGKDLSPTVVHPWQSEQTACRAKRSSEQTASHSFAFISAFQHTADSAIRVGLSAHLVPSMAQGLGRRKISFTPPLPHIYRWVGLVVGVLNQ